MVLESYFSARQSEISIPIHLYALFDGLHYAELEDAPMLERHPSGAIALFDGTRDASLADAGPWLVAYEYLGPEARDALARLASGPEGVNWLISAYAMNHLASELKERLDTRLPDGRTALLRYYDTRVMRHLAPLLGVSERLDFFFPTFDWWLEFDGQAMKVHPNA
ncbi:DUF4123 domain-containing protein [Paraburkholderia sp.]|uniref:DUF4123 domain-containing protein n=1 Tax=Paraburkholderia sp. TaxID=1926495 RepID=UPI003D6EB889